MQMLAAPTEVGPVDLTVRTRFAEEGFEPSTAHPLIRLGYVPQRAPRRSLSAVTSTLEVRATLSDPPGSVAGDVLLPSATDGRAGQET